MQDITEKQIHSTADSSSDLQIWLVKQGTQILDPMSITSITFKTHCCWCYSLENIAHSLLLFTFLPVQSFPITDELYKDWHWITCRVPWVDLKAFRFINQAGCLPVQQENSLETGFTALQKSTVGLYYYNQNNSTAHFN